LKSLAGQTSSPPPPRRKEILNKITCARGKSGFIGSVMSAQKEALVKLLRDDDLETVRLVKEQLAFMGEAGLSEVRELIEVDDVLVSSRAREVLAVIDARNACEEFSLLCHFFGGRVSLEQACWALARAIEPDVCTQAALHRINRWGREFLLKISGAVNNRERIRLLANFLSEELGFRGSADDYYSEKNSLIPRVLETRIGIPVTLTALYMMIGARAAMKIEGINLPGHFIARHGGIFFDPFHRGRILSQKDIEDILLRQGLEWDVRRLQAATPRQVVLRMLANLRYVYDLSGNNAKYARVAGWMDTLARKPRPSE